MPITAVIIDEVQVLLENPTREQVGGKKSTLGAYIADLLAYLVRKGPAAGIVVILATQRPDSNTIPSRLRAVLGSRFALRAMDWRDSNIVLGEQMNTRGFDASTLLPSHKGVGILRPDGETDAGADAETRLRRLRDAIEAGVEPAAMVEAINQAQEQRAAARAELDGAPAPDMVTEAEVRAMIDSLSDVSAALADAKHESLERLYRELGLELR
ncbi:hypothetical protein SAMN05421810_10978 [Amycolatopsis arida]|uniref:FtsK domain-containing protein n=1 Tax=Amycolatopsis arida TaxID=587909 RepID=A0A1I5ZDQ5_9PSEU|nr:hypothetical protein CLV69_10977 [Amycolatopsis arida]SFQ54560.1 hypothetical protein SAMN05421810_10978 [Amycolatopsis arida]